MYALVAHTGPAAFLERGEAWLAEREALYNLHLSLAYARRDKGETERDGLFGTVERASEVVGCVIRTPPHKLLVTDFPLEAAPAVVDVVSGMYETIPAVLGQREVAVATAKAWVKRRGGSFQVGMEQGLYRLDAVVPVTGVAGRLRLATSADFDLLEAWGVAFGEDAGSDFTLTADGVRSLLDRNAMFLWEDGAPVSMAVAQGVTGRGCRVGYVYTPPGRRGHGYASALVADVSQRMLDSGLEHCVLYTDLSNPTSNSIYQNVGYVRIAEVVDVDIKD